MEGFKYQLFRAALNTLYFSGAHTLLRPLIGGVGAILMLHHVRPPRRDRFQPNHLLEVTPKFFERVIRRLRRSRVDLISLDEMHRRLTTGDFPRRRFVCVTFDDGYRDNLEFAYPVLKKYEVPFAIYVATSFADRIGELWWLALEAVIAQNDMIGRSARRPRSLVRMPQRQGQARDLQLHLRAGCGSFRPRRSCGKSCATCARGTSVDMRGVLRRSVHGLGRTGDARRRPAGDDRRAHRQPSDPDQARRQGGARRAWQQPRRDRGGARRPRRRIWPIRSATARPRALASFESPRSLGFKTAVTTRPGVVFRAARRAPDRAAADFAQRQLPASALRQGSDLGRRHRTVERLPPGQRDLIDPVSIHRSSGIAGSTQPMPATT